MSLLQEVESATSLVAKVARFFLERPGQWLDGRVLASVAGSYAWRTRVSDLRRPPFNLTIDNRLRRVRLADGTVLTISEYRLSAGGRPR